MGVVRRRQLKSSSLSEAMTKKGRQIFFEKNRVTSSVAAPGDTNPSDATECHDVGNEIRILLSVE